jgi:hypothetical protein
MKTLKETTILSEIDENFMLGGIGEGRKAVGRIYREISF